MKKLACLSILIPALALAQDLPDTLCGVGTVAACAPVLTYQSAYGRVLVNQGGRQYDSGYGAVPQYSLAFSNVEAYASDGSSVHVSATFRTWTTRSARTVLTHWELLGGSIQ